MKEILNMLWELQNEVPFDITYSFKEKTIVIKQHDMKQDMI